MKKRMILQMMKIVFETKKIFLSMTRILLLKRN